MRHLKTLDVGPTDLNPLISANITALLRKQIRTALLGVAPSELFRLHGDRQYTAEEFRRTHVFLRLYHNKNKEK